MRSRTIKVMLAIILLGFGFLFGYYLIFLRFVRVITGSMSNTVIPGDHLVINKRVGKMKEVIFSHSSFRRIISLEQ